MAKAKRKNLSKKLRFEIFKRDEFTCQYCGATPPKVVLEVDHIVPVAKGGENDEDNLTTSCCDCNRGKAAISLKSVPMSLGEKAKKTKESEDQLIQFYKILNAKKDRLDEESWNVAEIMMPGCSESGFNIAKRTSIKNFLKKLNFIQVEESMEIAMDKYPYATTKTFKYFCGICWRKIKELPYGEN